MGTGNYWFVNGVKEKVMKIIDADALIENFGKLTVELWLDSVEEAEIVSLIGNAPAIKTKEVKYFDEDEKVWKIGEVIVDE